MITKENKCIASRGHVSEMGVSRLVRLAPHMGFLTFIKVGFPSYVLSHEMETPTSCMIAFIVTMSLTFIYVPSVDCR